MESARLIAVLTRMVRDVGIAEDLAQEALVAALEQWPEAGVPEKPGAWLMATAKHRALDLLRRRQMLDRKHEELGREMEAQELTVPDFSAALDDDIGDDLLRLMFIACHPVLSSEARVALTLRLLGGLTTDEIAQRSEADAQASYRALQSKFPAVLGSRQPLIKRADLGTKGVYYRAVIGPFASQEDASQMCGNLKTAGGQCVVQRN